MLFKEISRPMKLFENILICGHPDHVDLKLLEHAADLAKHNQSNVKVVHVVTDYPRDVRTWWNVRNPGKLRESIIRDREDFLDGLVESLNKLGVENVTRELHWGEPIVEITKDVLSDSRQLVMVVSKYSGKVSYGAFGYPSMDLVRQCPCPIWVTQKKVKKRVHRIVACLGGSGGDVKIEDTNAKMLAHAAAVAEAENSKLHVVHVMPLYGNRNGKRHDKNQLATDLGVYLDTVRNEIKQRCNDFLSDLGMLLASDQVHLLIGTPTTVIPDFVESNGADLLVMATAARTGLPGLVVGNAAEKVMKKIRCPMLVVKSDALSAQVKQPNTIEPSVAV